ncbi:MAG: hypothetical protein KAJ48_07390 [Elusimicrobiales bacterium]|nr:hypothetical protein [Elusimicrobiales bacterium]
MKLIIVEICFFLQIPLTWYLFKKFAKRNVLGQLMAGTMLGAFNEFATQPLWNYHLKINIYKDTPLCIVLGWGVMFTVVTFISEKLYCFFLKKEKIEDGDKRIFIFDVFAGSLFSFPMETILLKLGVWDYRYDLLNWNWGEIPFFKMPLEALFGYGLFMLIGPSFVRYWGKYFNGDSK